jgi:hypothetical protein
MAPPKYKDLGKSANDILNEDFKFEHSFEIKSKLNGVDIKSTFCDKGKGLTGAMEVSSPAGREQRAFYQLVLFTSLSAANASSCQGETFRAGGHEIQTCNCEIATDRSYLQIATYKSYLQIVRHMRCVQYLRNVVNKQCKRCDRS